MPPKPRGRPRRASAPPQIAAEEEAPVPVAAPRGRGRPRKNQAPVDLEAPTAPLTKTLKGEQPTTTRTTRAQALDSTAQGDPPIDGTVTMAARQGQTKMQAPASGRKPGRPRKIPVADADRVDELDVETSGNGNDNSDVEEEDAEQLAIIPPRKRGRPPKAKPTTPAAQPTPVRRGRGRPPKNRTSLSSAEALSSVEAHPAKRGRGRPRKAPLPDAKSVDANNVDAKEVDDVGDDDDADNNDKQDVAEPMIITPRKRGRPPKAKPDMSVTQPALQKRGPGRPPRNRTSLSSSEATPAKRGRGRPPKKNHLPLVPKTFNLSHALGSYKVECPAIAEMHAPGSSFDIDFCSVVNFQGEEILTASFDFIAFEGAMRCATSKSALEHLVTEQQNQEVDNSTSVDNVQEDDDAPMGEVTSDLIPAGSKRKASDIHDDEDEDDEAPPVKQVKLSSPPVLPLVLRGREGESNKCFESLDGTLTFENNLCKTFTAVATFPEVGEVTFEGLKVGGSGGNPGEWNDYSDMAFDAKETKGGEGDDYAKIYGDEGDEGPGEDEQDDEDDEL